MTASAGTSMPNLQAGLEDAHTLGVDPQLKASVMDVCAQFKKTLTMYRVFGEEHSSREMAENDLARALARCFQLHGREEVTLLVSPQALYFETESVFREDPNETDAIVRPIFLDGIQQLQIRQDVTAVELRKLVQLWHIAAHAKFPEGRSFTTEFWEADLQSMSMASVSTFSEQYETNADDAQVVNQKEVLIGALVRECSMPVLPEGVRRVSGGHKPGATVTVDLAGLDHESVRAVSLQDLARQDRKVSDAQIGLTPEEFDGLIAEIGTNRAHSPRRVIPILWRMLEVATDAEAEHVATLVARAYRMLAEEQRLDDLFVALSKTVEAARHTPERIGQLPVFLRGLTTPDLLSTLVRGLDDVARREVVMKLLHFVPRGQAGSLLAQLSVPTTEEGRTGLQKVIVSKRPTSEELVAYVDSLGGEPGDEAAAAALIQLADACGPEASIAVTNAALGHRELPIRLASLSRLTLDQLEPVRERVLALMLDRNREVRRTAIGLVMRIKDVKAVPRLVQILKGDRCEDDERKSIIYALGALGDPRVVPILVTELESGQDVEAKRAAALALGQLGGADVRDVLTKHTTRLLGNKELKDACREALRRLDVRGV